MNREEHHERAEKILFERRELLKEADLATGPGYTQRTVEMAAQLLAEAQVHATLAAEVPW